jgi:ribonuclease HI
MKFQLYTDGGYSMSADFGAFAYVILQDGVLLHKYAEKIEHETNNRAEIKAILYGVKALPNNSEVEVFSDSQYALGVLSGKYKAKKNPDLVEEYKRMVVGKNIKASYTWVRGHNGNAWNEVCDQLCNEAAGADLNVRTFSKEKPSQRLEDMDYNDLVELYKSVREELVRRNNEIESLIKEDIDYEQRRINESEG